LRYREELYESADFPEKELAALVTSKIYYHLQEYDESMTFALGAGNLFHITAKGEYEETMIGLSSYSINAIPKLTINSEMHREIHCYIDTERKHTRSWLQPAHILNRGYSSIVPFIQQPKKKSS